MITRILQLISVATVIVSLLAGCATLNPLAPNPADTTHPGVTIDYDALKRLSVTVAVIKVTKNHPERGVKIHTTVTYIREVAGTDGFNTVALLIDAVKLKSRYLNLEPEDRAIADFLISEIERNLQDNFGFGIIPTDKLLKVTELCDLVDSALGYPTHLNK